MFKDLFGLVRGTHHDDAESHVRGGRSLAPRSATYKIDTNESQQQAGRFVRRVRWMDESASQWIQSGKTVVGAQRPGGRAGTHAKHAGMLIIVRVCYRRRSRN